MRVLITGASGGLGGAVTQAFLDTGANVIGVSRRITQAEFASANFLAMPAELSNAEAANRLMERAGTVDALVHLVGGFAAAPVTGTDDATFERMLDLNLRSAFWLFRAALPKMREAGAGRIIAVGSRAAVEPGAGVGAYSASKAALVALVRSIALENKDRGITANVVLPGAIDTPANRKADPTADFSQWVAPERLASLMVWLASDAGAQITGAAIPMYGGAA